MNHLSLHSPAFKHKEKIPSKYTCDGADVNPPLVMQNIPPQTKSLALIVDDPDAPAKTWVHWLLWNIDPKSGKIKEASVPEGALQGMNDFKQENYGGPCPPSGTHRYFFKLYALDTRLELDQKATKERLEKAMQGHVLAEAEIIALYTRT